MVSFQELQYHFSPDIRLTFPDWEVNQGDHALILGPSGCGKTTLLHLMAGLLRPSTGQVYVAGKNLKELTYRQMDHYRGRHIGVIFQRPHLMSSLTVLENIRLPVFLARKPFEKGKLRQLLVELGLEGMEGRKIHQVSQGQAQRIAIARALVNDPDVLLCDEPTASLDDANCMKVIDLLEREAERHKSTLIIATHDQRVKSRFSNQLVL